MYSMSLCLQEVTSKTLRLMTTVSPSPMLTKGFPQLLISNPKKDVRLSVLLTADSFTSMCQHRASSITCDCVTALSLWISGQIIDKTSKCLYASLQANDLPSQCRSCPFMLILFSRYCHFTSSINMRTFILTLRSDEIIYHKVGSITMGHAAQVSSHDDLRCCFQMQDSFFNCRYLAHACILIDKDLFVNIDILEMLLQYWTWSCYIYWLMLRWGKTTSQYMYMKSWQLILLI